MVGVYDGLLRHGSGNDWLAQVGRQAEHRLARHPHGDIPRWRAALHQLPTVATSADLDGPTPRLGSEATDPEALRAALMELHPWRKGPLRLGGIEIDTEWRSDWKWARVERHLDVAGSRILDIGCGNGYYGLRMLGAGAELVVGIDPTIVFVMQWLACRHFSGELPNFVLPLGVEDLPPGPAEFDAVFSMGVLYHRRDHLQHLQSLKALLRPGGTLVLETLVLPANRENEVLVPTDRYARMRNVWAVPGPALLSDWVDRAGFENATLVDQTPTTTAEQRSTSWMRFESLEQALDPDDRARTVEGYPAPIRATLVATA